jgi:hypothetical protein
MRLGTRSQAPARLSRLLLPPALMLPSEEPLSPNKLPSSLSD